MKRVSKNGFTIEEQMELLKNPYTRMVTDTMIKRITNQCRHQKL